MALALICAALHVVGTFSSRGEASAVAEAELDASSLFTNAQQECQQAADADSADKSIKALQNCISLLETYSQKGSDAAKASMHAGAEYAKNLKTFGHFLSNVDSKVKDVYQKHSQKYGELHADQQKIFSSLIQQLQEYKEKLPKSEATGEDMPATEAGDGPAPPVLAQTSFTIQDAPPASALQEAEENIGSNRKHQLQVHKAEPSSHLEVHHKGHLGGKKHSFNNHAAGHHKADSSKSHAAGHHKASSTQGYHHKANSSKSHAAGHHKSHHHKANSSKSHAAGHHKANSSKSHAASHLEVVEQSHEKKHGHGGAHHEAHKAKHKKHGHHSDHLSQASTAHRPASFMQLSGHHHRHRKRKRTRAAKHRHQKHKHEEDDESNGHDREKYNQAFQSQLLETKSEAELQEAENIERGKRMLEEAASHQALEASLAEKHEEEKERHEDTRRETGHHKDHKNDKKKHKKKHHGKHHQDQVSLLETQEEDGDKPLEGSLMQVEEESAASQDSRQEAQAAQMAETQDQIQRELAALKENARIKRELADLEAQETDQIEQDEDEDDQ